MFKSSGTPDVGLGAERKLPEANLDPMLQALGLKEVLDRPAQTRSTATNQGVEEITGESSEPLRAKLSVKEKLKVAFKKHLKSSLKKRIEKQLHE